MKRPADVDMKGKVCIVTGASAGIGRETAVALARMGADVFLVCRHKEKAEAALADVKTRGKNENAALFLADLSSLEEVRRVADELRAKTKRVDVLVNNAGAIHQTRKLTKDGLEATFAGNHLGYFLLTQELLPLLKTTAPSRIVNVASDAHVGMTLDFDDLQSEKGYFPLRVYGRSKLANVLFTYELARRLEGTGVTANCLHPGVVATGFGRNDPGLFKFLVSLGVPFMRTAEKGAWTTIHVATAPALAGVTGKYFADMKEKRSSGPSYDVTAQQRLWEVSERLCQTPVAP